MGFMCEVMGRSVPPLQFPDVCIPAVDIAPVNMGVGCIEGAVDERRLPYEPVELVPGLRDENILFCCDGWELGVIMEKMSSMTGSWGIVSCWLISAIA
jgi:hypothetical protein